jgi:tRNA uridine 5-carbamoylmethylation protein Kti12
MTPLAVCQERNSQRTGRLKVPETAINNMFKSFAPPGNDEKFDNVYFIDEWGNVISE